MFEFKPTRQLPQHGFRARICITLLDGRKPYTGNWTISITESEAHSQTHDVAFIAGVECSLFLCLAHTAGPHCAGETIPTPVTNTSTTYTNMSTFKPVDYVEMWVSQLGHNYLQ